MDAFDTPQRDPSAWKGEDFTRDPSWLIDLDAGQAAELEAAARAVQRRGLALATVGRDDFALPTLGPVVRGWADEIERGRGFLVVRGLPADRLDDAQVRTIFWGIGMHLGTPVSQNSYGDMLGDVFDEGVKMGTGRVRGYRTNQRLMFHTDRCDTIGLLCLRQARTGGSSSLVSSTRIYQEITRTRPDLLPALYEGYIHVNFEEGGDLSTYRVPVYSVTDGVVSCRILRNTIESARRMGHAKYDALHTDALELMDTLANRDDMRLDMMLERGDMQFLNNYTTLHARTAFEDHPEPERRRHMVRLWLTAHGARRRTARDVFKDYDGVPKTLERKPGMAGIV